MKNVNSYIRWIGEVGLNNDTKPFWFISVSVVDTNRVFPEKLQKLESLIVFTVKRT